MADNVSVTPGSGVIIATRDAGGGVEVQRVIPNVWNGSTATDASFTAPLPIARVADWSQAHTPATATQATTTKAAGGSGVRHVATSLTVAYAAGASAITAAAPLLVNLRDGGTGAGTILWSSYVNVPAVAAQCFTLHLGALSIFGSANTAMTLEFSAAGGTNSFQSVALSGYDANWF